MTDGQRPIALITGGLHRVGAAIAKALAVAGCDLVLHYRQNGAAEDGLAEDLATSGAAWWPVQADLADGAAVDGLFAAAAALAGRTPSILINNASLFSEGGWDSLTSESMAQHLAINLTAPVLLTQALAKAGGGVVVNVLDQRVINPVPDQTAYTISKQALWQATRTLAISMAPAVRVNAVAPGLTLPTDDYADGQMDRLAGAMPLGVLPTPQEIAEAVVYLVNAKSVTGQTIFVDGGANLRSYDRDFVAM
jgi:NAD(P)-dependent dehydrogenase (short-subunit alcohol dehydrogenase family)